MSDTDTSLTPNQARAAMGVPPSAQAAAAGLLAAHQGEVWAVRPQMLDMLRGVAAGRLTLDSPAPTPADARGQIGGATRLERSGVTVTRDGVAIVPLRGVITPTGSFLSYLLTGYDGGLNGFCAAMHEAVAHDDVTAVLIDVDSPGGSVRLLQETAAAIRGMLGVKPIVALANTMAASAAYWLATQVDDLSVTPSGVVGSVGTLLVHEDISRLLDAEGITVSFVHAGRYKTEGTGARPLDDEARAEWQRVVDDHYAIFEAEVAAGRGVTAQKVRDDFGQGRVLEAPRAVAVGMADRVETIDQILARLGQRTPARRPIGARADVTPPEPVDASQPDAAAEVPAPPKPEEPTPPAPEPPEAPEPDAEALAAAARMRAQRAFGAR